MIRHVLAGLTGVTGRTPGVMFHVAGEPVGEPRARPSRAGGRLRVHRDARADRWKLAVRSAAEAAMGAPPPHTGDGRYFNAPLFRRPVLMVAEFRFTPGTPGVDAWCTATPDVDNLAKAVMDAVGPWPKGARPLLWKDDRIVVATSLWKRYVFQDETPGATVACWTLYELREPEGWHGQEAEAE